MNTKPNQPGGDFVLTMDLADRMQAFETVDLRVPDLGSSFYRDCSQELLTQLRAAFDGTDTVVHDIGMRHLSGQIVAAIDRHFGNDVFVVSTCPEITYPSNGRSLQINRLANRHGEAIGLGARPGYPTLREQISQIGRAARGQRVVLAEDGMFTGNTVLEVASRLKAQGVNLVGVVVGFTFDQKYVEQLTEKHGIEVLVVNDFGKLLDWVPDHDFLPFIPGCGRVLGVDMGGIYYPFYTHEHVSYSFPYVKPFGPTTQWASIPEAEPQQGSPTFSGRCVQLSIDIFQELNRLNNRSLTIGDLVHARQRVSIPLTVASLATEQEEHLLPAVDTSVMGFLAESL